jgi:predicted permease
MFEHERPASLLVLAASGLLLLLACANLSTLLLAHARARERRAAISAAIGATRWRLVRQALAEAVIVCVCGTIAAFAVLAPAATALASALPPLVARHATGVMDLRVLAAAAAAAAICAAAAGLGPALRATRVDLLALLQRMPTSARRQRTSLKASLLAVESALAVLLAVSAMLLLRTFANLERDDIGFEPRGLHTVMVAGPRASRGEDLTAFYEQAAETIGSIPGIAAVAVGDSVAVAGAAPWSGSQTSDGTRFARYEVSASYFDTLQSAPVAGRPFTTAEARARARVALLNLSGARQLWPDALPANVVGRVVTFKDGSSLTVVGVLPDFKPGYGALSRAVPLALFVPFGLDPAPIGDIVVRTVTGGPPDVSMLRQRIRDRLAGVTSVETFPVEERYLSSLRDPRFRATLLATLALTGLLVAASGLLAVALFDARQREYEIGVRLSYGATGGDIQRLIVAHASRPVAAGLAIGIVAAYWATTFLQQFLYQIEPRDPGTYAVVAGIVALTALAATWLPAWRAGRLDPSIVLRAQ